MSSLVKSVLKALTGKRGIAGMAVGVGLSLARGILAKRGARANLEFLIAEILPGGIEPTPYPDDVDRAAEAIHALFTSRQLVPERIAVDGVPGSGKSSLAAALAGRLQMTVVCLDRQNLDQPLSFDSPSAIYEHHRLLRTQDLESFDAIVYIDEPVEISKEKVLQRKRGAYLVDIMDYDRLKRIGERAFAMADGQTTVIDDGFVKVKIRPEKGFNDRENIARELRGKGLDATGLNKEQALFLCVEGQARKGLRAYANPHAYDRELLSALVTGLSRWVRPKRGR